MYVSVNKKIISNGKGIGKRKAKYAEKARLRVKSQQRTY